MNGSETDTNAEEQHSIRRREVLRAAGTAGVGAVGLAAVSGTAVAADTPDQLYFCGCSQLVVTGLGRGSEITVYLRRTEEGGCRTRTISEPDCHVGDGREYAFRYTVSGGKAILAVETPDGNVWCNPNNCAQKWIDELTCFDLGGAETLRDVCTDYSNLDQPGDVFTNRCGTVCSGGGGGGPPEGAGPP